MACPDIDDLAAYAGGGLPPSSRANLEAHMDSCSECRCVVSETARAARASATLALDIEALSGERVGRFELRDALGTGAAGVVYRAYDPELEREVALKVMRPRRDGAESELGRQRMLREGRALARVSHPNVVTVYEVGRHEDMVYVAMEQVTGGNLRDWLEDAERSAAEIARLLAGVARGLEAVHRAGLIHRDLKPQNILVGESGEAQVGDFGLACLADDLSTGSASPADSSLAMTLTHTGVSVGTPAYMAPEILRGEPATVASDLYALGVTLYEALHGQRPFPQLSLAERLAAADAALDFGQVESPLYLQELLRKALAPVPEHRFASGEDFARALVPDPHAARRWPLVLAAGLAAMFFAFVLVWRSGDDATSCKNAGRDVLATFAARDSQLSDVFANYDAPYAEVLWRRVRASSADYAQRLSTAQLALCRSKSIQAPQRQARLACLQRLEGGFATTTELWASGDPELLQKAPQSLAALSNPESCERALPGKGDVDARVIRLQALVSAGDTDEAEPLARTLIDELDKDSYGQLLARMELGKLQREAREIGKAQTIWRDIAARAETIGADDLRAEAWIHLASIGSDEAGDIEEAKQALALAAGVIERLGALPALDVRLQLARARLALRQNRGDEAAKHLRFALLYPANSFDEALKRQLLARAYSVSGKPREMLIELTMARDLVDRAAGPRHPDMIPILNSMMEAHANLGNLDEAFAVGNEALAMTEEIFGPENLRMASVLNNLSILYSHAEKQDTSIEFARRAIAVSEKIRGADHPDLAVDRLNLAGALMDAGQLDEAKELYELAHEGIEAALGPSHVQLSFTELGLAAIAAEEKQFAEAIARARRGVALREQEGTDPFLRAVGSFSLAQILAMDGQRRAAIATVDEALAKLPEAESARQSTLIDEIKAFRAAQSAGK